MSDPGLAPRYFVRHMRLAAEAFRELARERDASDTAAIEDLNNAADAIEDALGKTARFALERLDSV